MLDLATGGRKVTRTALLLCTALFLLPAGCAGAKDAAPDGAGTALEVYCFQAGKADALLLTTDTGTVLIDCGERGFGQTILDELAARGRGRVDYLILTHFDRDHVGGAAKVLNNIEVGTVLQSNHPKDSTEYEKYVKALRNAGLEAVTVRDVYEFSLDGVRFSVDPPRKNDYEEDASNNSSLIVTVYNGADVLLFMGDAQTERLAEYLEAGPVDCDFLKAPHHGGEEEGLDALIAAVRPECAVITSSDEEPEAASTVAALRKAGAEVYLTRVAAVTIRSDGTSVTARYAE